jgi:RNA polymerase sigma factor (sigma-70 family)
MTSARIDCEGCPFRDAEKRCSLLMAGRMRDLLGNEDCALHRRMPPLVESYFARHFTRHASYAEDVAQDVLRELIEVPQGHFRFARLEDLLGWIPRHLHRRTIDALRKSREIARPRCGACAHFARGRGCRLDPLRRVGAATNPTRLEDPCFRFAWAQPTVALPEDHEPSAPAEPVAVERDEELLERALRELEARDPKGRKAVTAIRMHSLGGLTMMQAGRALGVSHMSVKRAVDYGIRELRGILAHLRGDRRTRANSALFPSLRA